MFSQGIRVKNIRKLGQRILPFLAGFVALLWFLIRVVPKPSRAAYPCQRAAFPLASAFVLWVIGILTSGYLLRRGKTLIHDNRLMAATVCLFLALIVGTVSWLGQPSTPVLAAPSLANVPIGEAKGIHPGRVVWNHNPDATDWEGPGHGHWWEPEHTDQAVVGQMLSASLLSLTGETEESVAWDALIRSFNAEHGNGSVGYTPGQKIMIKVNLVGCHYLPGWGGADGESYDLVTNQDYMNTSPQMMLALLRQLVNVVGAAQSDITIGDPLSIFPNQYHAVLAEEFPQVNYLDHEGGTPEHPRLAARNSSIPFHWSDKPTGVQQDFILESYARADYFINLANFKSHLGAGVTLCAKNHYGSLSRYPTEEGFHDLHQSLAFLTAESANYRAIVDMMGHAKLGGNTLLYLIDGLYSGCHPDDQAPMRWAHEHFGNDWTNSIFASQDPVAIESVCLDIMQLEGDPRLYPQQAGADDYLHEAALAHDPPSGTYYDPDHAGDVTRLMSLGVHEHWNDPVNMQYSRNLGIGDGIELVRVPKASPVPEAKAVFASFVYPNPFNPCTAICFDTREEGRLELAVYDVTGARVATVLNQSFAPGKHEVPWQGTDDAGRVLSSGVYYYSIQQGMNRETGKMTLVR
jgi:Domain of unknown function (DUF362)/FlgD Ig-like domain